MKVSERFDDGLESSKDTNIIPILYMYGVVQTKEEYCYAILREKVLIGHARLAYGGFYQVKSKRCKRWSKALYKDVNDSIMEINKRMR